MIEKSSIKIENVIVPINFKVIDSGSQEIPIRMDWMRKAKAKFDAEKMELKVQSSYHQSI